MRPRAPRCRSRATLIGAVAAAACVATISVGPAASAPAPTLTLKALRFAPREVAPGGDFALTGKVRNRGEQSPRLRIRAFLLEPGGARVRAGGRRLRVRAGSGRRFRLDGKVPPGLAPGAYVVSACIPSGSGERSCRRAKRKLIVSNGSAFTPGARSLGDPLFPEVGNGGYDALHYDLDINWVAAQNAFVDGTRLTMTAEATQNLSELSLDLEGLSVGAVSVDGIGASVSRVAPAACSATPPCPPTKLVIVPAAPLEEGEQFTVEVAYTGSPAAHTDPDGSDEGWTDTGDGAFVVNEPIGAMTWIPCNNHPTDKATFDFELTVPTGHTAIGNGEQVAPAQDNGDGTTTWHWRMDQPMATYLSTATVGIFDFGAATTPQGLDVYSFLDSGFTAPQKVAAQAIIDRQEEMVDYFTTLYGAYPFGSTGVVADDADVGYALEVQTKSHFDSAVVDPGTLSHEIAHQWLGDSVTPDTWRDIWLNEGWAEWSEWQWDYEENGGLLSPAQRFDANYTPGTGSCPADKWCQAPAEPSAETMFRTFPIYTRTAMMVEALRQVVGTGRFLELARSWHTDHIYANATTAQFIALAKQKSGLSGANLAKLDTFFQQWLFGTTMPTITGANFFS